MDVLSLMAKLSLDSSGYEEGLGEAEEKAQTAGQKIGSGLKTAGKVGAAAIAGLATGTVAISGALIKGASATAQYGDEVDKMSQKIGISSDAYQEWDAILQHSGASISSMQGSMKALSNAAESGNEAFERIGMSMDDVASMSQEDLFSAVITSLQNMENGTEKTYLATQLLGRGATEFGALLNTSAEETEAMRQRVHELGGVMSGEGVKAAAKFQDALQDMKTASGSLKRNLTSSLLPGMTEVMSGLTDIFAGDSESGLGAISAGINDLINNITEILPQFLEVGTSIVLSLSQAIVNNLPRLISAGAQAFMSIITGLVEQLPALIEAGLEIVIELANGIAQAIPQLTSTITDVIIKIAQILTNPDSISRLIDAAVEIILALTDGLMEALPQLLDMLPEILDSIVNTLIDNVDKLLEAALTMIVTLGKALIDYIPQLVWRLPTIITKIVEKLTEPEQLQKIINAGVDLLVALVENLPAIILGIVKAVPDIIDGLVEGFRNLLSTFWDLGVELMNKIWEGMKSVAKKVGGWLAEQIKATFSGDGDIIGLMNDAAAASGMNKTFVPGQGWVDNVSSGGSGFDDDIGAGIVGNTSFSNSGMGKSSSEMINTMSGGSSGGGNLNVNVNVDSDTVARATLPGIYKVSSAYGTPLTT